MSDAEPGRLRLLDRVAVFVPDHLEVLGVVDTALPEPDQVLRRVEVAVVDPVLVHLDRDAVGLDVREAETLDVLLGAGDRVVRHHLLEALVVPAVQEPPAGLERPAAGATDGDEIALEVPAPIEVIEAGDHIRGLERRVVLILAVGERLVMQRHDRVRQEDATGGGRHGRSTHVRWNERERGRGDDQG